MLNEISWTRKILATVQVEYSEQTQYCTIIVKVQYSEYEQYCIIIIKLTKKLDLSYYSH